MLIVLNATNLEHWTDESSSTGAIRGLLRHDFICKILGQQ
jgi:hypothetical protein